MLYIYVVLKTDRKLILILLQVHREIRNSYRKFKLYLQERFNLFNEPTSAAQRRRTDATYVRNSIAEQHSRNLPKILITSAEQEPNDKVQDWLKSNNDESCERENQEAETSFA